MKFRFRRVCVYCGSSGGQPPVYLEAARAFGVFLAEHGMGLVYGGGRIGLMGAVADGAIDAGGEVFGVIPEKLRDLELAHPGLTELFVVDGMHARKTLMAQLSDAFVALPGGWGTLEEVFEVTTWAQLNHHHKPVGLLNVNGFYDAMIAHFDRAAADGFVRPAHRQLLRHADDAASLMKELEAVEFPDLRSTLKL